jgi:hypothetical protein
MKFRFVLLDPDGDADRHAPPRENAAAGKCATPPHAFQYQIRGTGMVRQQRLPDGRLRLIPVANFRASIVTDIILDDGAEQRRHCGVEAELDGQKVVFTVPAAEFGRMGWVLSRLGPRAIVYPGQMQHARAAIQELSGPIRQERIFAHLGTRIGWVAGGDLYLEPTASYAVAQAVAGTARLSVSEQTLRQRLREQGLLASIDAGRQMLQVRRTLSGRPRQVLHLRTSDVVASRWLVLDFGKNVVRQPRWQRGFG